MALAARRPVSFVFAMFRQCRFWLGRPLAAAELAGGLFALTTDLQVRQLAALLEPWSAASPATREEGSEAGEGEMLMGGRGRRVFGLYETTISE